VPYLLVSLGGIIGDILEYIGGFHEGANLGKNAVEYCSCLWLWRLSLLCATLGEFVLSLSCVVAAVGWCILVPSHATVVARVYLLVLVWLSRIILSRKG
jgi:hypothetical protein